MKILVTGSHGYIGSVLAPLLAEAGHDVVGLDTRFYRGCDFGPEVGEIETVTRDVRELAPAELSGFDAIVHLAALSNDPVGDLDPALTEAINHEATVRLAESAKQVGVERFVFASSCSMYGASGSDDALTEEAPLRPITAYAESKVRSEEGLARLAGPGFRPGLDAERDRLRGLAPSPPRHRPQQPRRLEPHDRPDPAAQRRDRVAAADPRARRRQDGVGAPRGPDGGRLAGRPSTSAPMPRTTLSATWPSCSPS